MMQKTPKHCTGQVMPSRKSGVQKRRYAFENEPQINPEDNSNLQDLPSSPRASHRIRRRVLQRTELCYLRAYLFAIQCNSLCC